MYTKREYNTDVAANAQATLDNIAALEDFSKRHEAGEHVDSDAWNAAHDRGYELENERRDMDRRFRQRNWNWHYQDQNQVRRALLDNGWKAKPNRNYTKRIEGFAPAGTVSDGTRIVCLTIDDTGRWLERVDGWGNVERDVDLRDFPNDPQGAIAAVLK